MGFFKKLLAGRCFTKVCVLEFRFGLSASTSKVFLQNACFGISFWAAFVLLWGRLGGALGQVRARHGTFLAEASLWEPAFGHFPAALEGSKNTRNRCNSRLESAISTPRLGASGRPKATARNRRFQTGIA